MDREAWRAEVHGVGKSWKQLSDWTELIQSKSLVLSIKQKQMFFWNSLVFSLIQWQFDGNLISGSSAFSKSSLNIWKFMVHILLHPGLVNFEHYFTSMGDECICNSLRILWHCLSLGLEWKLTFFKLWPVLIFQICWPIEFTTFTALSLWIWNSSTAIPSPPLALFIVMLPKAHLISHSRMSGSRWVITPSWMSGSWRSFFYTSSVYSCHLFVISLLQLCACHFCPLLCPFFHETFPWYL